MKTYDPHLVDRLTGINLEDIFTSLGWEKIHAGRRLLEWPLRGAASRFACQVLDFDRLVGEMGLQAGSQCFLQAILKDLMIEGQERIPITGPVLFLANHPGVMDTVSLFAGIPRADLKVVAAERPFLKALPATSSRLIYVPEKSAERMEVIRAVAAQLRSGGAVLTFPAGQIEPDPAVLRGAEHSLEDWSASIGIFSRLAPTTTLIPVVVSGVLSPRATFHPLTRLRRQSKDRERLGATLQILASVIWPSLWPDLWRVTIHLRFGLPILAAEINLLHDPQEITRAVVAQIKPWMREIANQDFLR